MGIVLSGFAPPDLSSCFDLIIRSVEYLNYEITFYFRVFKSPLKLAFTIVKQNQSPVIRMWLVNGDSPVDFSGLLFLVSTASTFPCPKIATTLTLCYIPHHTCVVD